jgi:hypothetical protein
MKVGAEKKRFFNQPGITPLPINGLRRISKKNRTKYILVSFVNIAHKNQKTRI